MPLPFELDHCTVIAYYREKFRKELREAEAEVPDDDKKDPTWTDSRVVPRIKNR